MALLSTLAMAAPTPTAAHRAGNADSVFAASGRDGSKGELFWTHFMYQQQQRQPCMPVAGQLAAHASGGEQPQLWPDPTAGANDAPDALDAITAQRDLAQRLRTPTPTGS